MKPVRWQGVDWWALGVLLYEMLAGDFKLFMSCCHCSPIVDWSGYPPFYDENPYGIYQKAGLKTQVAASSTKTAKTGKDGNECRAQSLAGLWAVFGGLTRFCGGAERPRGLPTAFRCQSQGSDADEHRFFLIFFLAGTLRKSRSLQGPHTTAAAAGPDKAAGLPQARALDAKQLGVFREKTSPA